ncbi:DNA-binding protein [Acetobacter tropicalis]|uniref:DNA-binding protein n=2 Tax=Acetobacteraceae TaxID=433 RepID=A0A291PGU7_9PROT|nr:DNA-binding protein [Acetobacter tropicalis]
MRLEKKVSWPKPLILSEADAANMLNIAPRTLQAKRLDGSGPAFVQLTKRRIGYAVSDLEAWIETCRYKTTKEAKSSYDQNQELMRKY